MLGQIRVELDELPPLHGRRVTLHFFKASADVQFGALRVKELPQLFGHRRLLAQKTPVRDLLDVVCLQRHRYLESVVQLEKFGRVERANVVGERLLRGSDDPHAALAGGLEVLCKPLKVQHKRIALRNVLSGLIDNEDHVLSVGLLADQFDNPIHLFALRETFVDFQVVEVIWASKELGIHVHGNLGRHSPTNDRVVVNTVPFTTMRPRRRHKLIKPTILFGHHLQVRDLDVSRVAGPPQDV